MFDKYNIQSGPSHISANIDVTEKRAPTDESVKLLREMEEKARKQVLHSYITESNVLSGAHVGMCLNSSVLSKTSYALFKLNGIEYRVEAEIETTFNERDCLEQLVEKLSKAISVELVQQLIKEDGLKWEIS